MYTWVDEHGTVHFQEAPPARKRAKKVLLPEQAPQPPAPPTARGEAREQPHLSPPLPRTPAVELFGASWCSACRKARDYFTRRGIPFTEHDLDREPGARERLRTFDRGGAIPVVVIAGEVFVGFRPAAYDRALQRR